MNRYRDTIGEMDLNDLHASAGGIVFRTICGEECIL